MNVNQISGAIPNSQVQSTSDTLGKDEFLKILVAQLKYQDPLNPMDDKDFISQMAQFSSLEQMTNLNTSFTMSHAVGLVGKDVVAKVTNSETGGTELTAGTVEAIYSNNGIPYLKIGDQYVTMDSVQAVFDRVAEEKVEGAADEQG